MYTYSVYSVCIHIVCIVYVYSICTYSIYITLLTYTHTLFPQVYKYTASTSIHVAEKAVEDHEISVVCKNTLLQVVDSMVAIAPLPVLPDTVPMIPTTGSFCEPLQPTNQTKVGFFSGSVKDWVRTTSSSSKKCNINTAATTPSNNNTNNNTTTTTSNNNTTTRQNRAISSPTATTSTINNSSSMVKKASSRPTNTSIYNSYG